MSSIFGIRYPPGLSAETESLRRLAEVTDRYGPDATNLFNHGRIGMGFQAFHTHIRSRLERQPAVDCFGNVLALDGRLDNHVELAARFDLRADEVSDASLILRAFEKYGPQCFSEFIGEWALSLWCVRDSVLYLARDHAGSRSLFYKCDDGRITWSTYLETFFVNSSFPEWDREYMARILSSQEIRDLTPFKGIRAVRPAHYLAIRDGQEVVQAHWRWIAEAKIVYRTDTEYDEHFLHLFRRAVERRVGAGARILAELSGGMDSTSIVCMADEIAGAGGKHSNQLDSVSYFDETEPDWDERPFVSVVERSRNKIGIHVECSGSIPSYEPLNLAGRIYPYPGSDQTSFHDALRFEESVGAGRYRVILSGMGGDELLGGVASPLPALANYVRAGRLVSLVSKAIESCIVDRQPLFRTLRNTASFTLRLYGAYGVESDTVPPWLSPELRRLCLQPRPRRESTRDLLTLQPSALANSEAWWALLETLPHLAPRLLGCYEYRYPYLDRDLVEFLARIPREQIAQPGRRRLLMRRALRGLVPVEILERRRKAFVSHGPLTYLRAARSQVEGLFSNALIADNGFIDRGEVLRALRSELSGDLKWLRHLTKAIYVELWLRAFTAQFESIRSVSRTSELRHFASLELGTQAPPKQC